MISIIGAGPVGSYLAYLASKHSKVQVYEEHRVIGKPIQCTGIMTSLIEGIIPIRKQFLVNTIDRADIIAPNGKRVSMKLKEKNVIVHRALFDQHIAEKAQDQGATFLSEQRFLSAKREGTQWHLHFQGKTKEAKTDVLVGTDGPGSQVAKSIGLWGKRKFMIGVQARVSMDVDPGLVEFYVAQDGMIGWVVPENESIARLGIGAYANANDHFRRLMKRCAPGCKIREYQSGLIPVYNPSLQTEKDNAFLVGDAATHVKATTYGGIIQGMMAAEELNKTLLKGGSYHARWKKRIGRDLWLSLYMRKKLDAFSDKKYNSLVELFQQPKLKSILETYDRDVPTKFALQLLLREPRLLLYAF